MKVVVILIIIGVLGTVTKGLENGLEVFEIGKPSSLQHCWDRPEYSEVSRRPEETYCHNAGVKTRKE